MSTRRMISNRICSSAKFIQMPDSSQLLYVRLVINADDDGIVEAYPLMQLYGIKPDDFKILEAKSYIKPLNEYQVLVVTDWLEHNRIRADKKVNSIYLDLLLSTYPEIPVLKPKKRADRLYKEAEERTHYLGRPREINNGTLMGHKRDTIGTSQKIINKNNGTELGQKRDVLVEESIVEDNIIKEDADFSNEKSETQNAKANHFADADKKVKEIPSVGPEVRKFEPSRKLPHTLQEFQAERRKTEIFDENAAILEENENRAKADEFMKHNEGIINVAEENL